MPAARSAATASLTAARFATTSRPPCVVSSCGCSGTSVTWSGRMRAAIPVISAVAAISMLSLVDTTCRSSSTSRSLMWRRSPRRWTVMPCAPASSARMAAATGSGSRALRASRMVAM